MARYYTIYMYMSWILRNLRLFFNPFRWGYMYAYQWALTEGAGGGEVEARVWFPQSFPFLEAKAIKNLLLASFPSLAKVEDEEVMCLEQAWSAGNRCFKQILIWQCLQVLELEKVKTSLHRLTGQVGFFFFLGSQSPDFSCFRSIDFSSTPSYPVVSMDVEHISQTTTFRLLCSDLGQSWAL